MPFHQCKTSASSSGRSVPALSNPVWLCLVVALIASLLPSPTTAAQSCYSDFTDLKIDVSGSLFQLPSVPGSPTGQKLFTICPGSILQMDQPFSSSPNIWNIGSGSLFQCGENGSGTDCIFEPLGSGANFPFFRVSVSGVRFVGLTFRNSQNAMRISESAGSATFERCIFSDNDGTGIATAVEVGYGSSATFIDCRFERNAGGRIVYNGGSVTMDACVFQDNPSITESSMLIRSQTDVGLDPARLTLSNSCFYNNGGADIILIQPGSIINDSTSGNNYGEGNVASNCDGFFFQDDASCVAFDADIAWCEVTSPPTIAPSTNTSSAPSFAPSIGPSRTPSPSAAPTIMPTAASDAPSDAPSASDAPSVIPSIEPTTDMPSDLPSITPTGMPTSRPTVMVSASPSSLKSETPEPTSGTAATHILGVLSLGISVMALSFVL
jgi:hypothetical protein